MSTEYAHLCGCPQPTPYQVGGFLPSSSLSPRALVGEVSSLSPTQTVGGLWAPPRSALQSGDSPAPGLSPEGRDSSSFFSFPKHAEGDCCGKWYCTAGSAPLLPTALSKRGCHQNQEALGGRGFSWAGPRLQVQQLPPPSSSEQESQPRGREGVHVYPHMFLSVNNLH